MVIPRFFYRIDFPHFFAVRHLPEHVVSNQNALAAAQAAAAAALASEPRRRPETCQAPAPRQAPERYPVPPREPIHPTDPHRGYPQPAGSDFGGAYGERQVDGRQRHAVADVHPKSPKAPRVPIQPRHDLYDDPQRGAVRGPDFDGPRDIIEPPVKAPQVLRPVQAAPERRHPAAPQRDLPRDPYAGRGVAREFADGPERAPFSPRPPAAVEAPRRYQEADYYGRDEKHPARRAPEDGYPRDFPAKGPPQRGTVPDGGGYGGGNGGGGYGGGYGHGDDPYPGDGEKIPARRPEDVNRGGFPAQDPPLRGPEQGYHKGGYHEGGGDRGGGGYGRGDGENLPHRVYNDFPPPSFPERAPPQGPPLGRDEGRRRGGDYGGDGGFVGHSGNVRERPYAEDGGRGYGGGGGYSEEIRGTRYDEDGGRGHGYGTEQQHNAGRRDEPRGAEEYRRPPAFDGPRPPAFDDGRRPPGPEPYERSRDPAGDRRPKREEYPGSPAFNGRRPPAPQPYGLRRDLDDQRGPIGYPGPEARRYSEQEVRRYPEQEVRRVPVPVFTEPVDEEGHWGPIGSFDPELAASTLWLRTSLRCGLQTRAAPFCPRVLQPGPPTPKASQRNVNCALRKPPKAYTFWNSGIICTFGAFCVILVYSGC